MADNPPSSSDGPLERALRRIESDADEPVSLAALAEAAGLSTYHFARQFTARFGVSPMAYVRQLRLVAAAERLRKPPPPSLIELAFDSGFDSQEGFTRAFKRVFGAPPGAYRRRIGEPTPCQEQAPMSDPIQARAALTQAAEPVRKPALRIAGLAADFEPGAMSGIPDLWDQFLPRLPLPGQAGGEAFGVCMGQASGAMRYMAGAPIAPGAAPPPGLEVIELPARTYLIFRQVLDGGPLHPQMQAAAKEIWGERLPQSAYKLARSPDLEAYPPGFSPDQAGAYVEWWIPVEA